MINAMPFYTRLWKTEAGSLSSGGNRHGYSPRGLLSRRIMHRNIFGDEVRPNLWKLWELKAALTSGLDQRDTTVYRCKRYSWYLKYNLVGVAAWKLGFEVLSIWRRQLRRPAPVNQIWMIKKHFLRHTLNCICQGVFLNLLSIIQSIWEAFYWCAFIYFLSKGEAAAVSTTIEPEQGCAHGGLRPWRYGSGND